MAIYTVAQRDALAAQIATGELDIQSGDRRVRYNSLKEMMDLLAVMNADLAVASASDPSTLRFARVGFSRD